MALTSQVCCLHWERKLLRLSTTLNSTPVAQFFDAVLFLPSPILIVFKYLSSSVLRSKSPELHVILEAK